MKEAMRSHSLPLRSLMDLAGMNDSEKAHR